MKAHWIGKLVFANRRYGKRLPMAGDDHTTSSERSEPVIIKAGSVVDAIYFQASAEGASRSTATNLENQETIPGIVSPRTSRVGF